MVGCRRCDRTLVVRFTQWLRHRTFFCSPRDQAGCTASWMALNVQPPEEDEPDHPDCLAPDDIDVCGVCRGPGEVFTRRDWSTGAYETERCTWCAGTGTEPGR